MYTRNTYDDRGYIATEDIDSTYTLGETTVTVDIYKEHDYDGMGRLKESDVTVDNATTTTSWTYDSVGNRLTENDGTNLLDYDYNKFNQLTEIDIISGGTTYEYMDYTYDDRGNELTQTETLSGGTETEVTTYSYDAAGNLNKTDDGTDVTKRYYNRDAWASNKFRRIYDQPCSGQRTKQELIDSVTSTVEETTKYYYTGSSLLFTTNGDGDKLTENILTPGGSIVASRVAWASSKFRRIYDQPCQ